MCGRLTLRATGRSLAKGFGMAKGPIILPRYNIAPTQDILAVRLDDEGQKEFCLLRWGLIPEWAEDPSIGAKLINARAEAVRTKPAFRQAFRCRRCLIPADGFYEWQTQGHEKQPMLIARRDGRPFAFAGLWEQWHSGGRIKESCTIITTDADEFLSDAQDRMPIIISPDDYDRWLSADPDDAEEFLHHPASTDELTMFPVSRIVNNPHNDVPQCVAPIAVLSLF
jgi:putative SOS response-associated peptidase YedK